MRIIRNPELKGILGILLIALVLGVILAGMSGKLEQWGLPWFTGARAFDKIIFVSDASGTREIYAMNLDGSGRKQLTSGARVLSAPAMTPAGNRIVFVGMCGSISHVMAIGVNGGTPYALTTSTGSKRQPEFSPDGKKLSYIEAGRVYVAEINGSNPDPVLPTHEEMAMAMSSAENRSAIPLYSAYSWAPDSAGLAGVSSQDRLTDSLSYLPEPEGELARLTPAGMRVRVVGLEWAGKRPLLAVSLDLESQRLLAAFDPEQKQLSPVMGVGLAKLGAPAVSLDGSVIVVPVETQGKGGGWAVVRADLGTERAGVLIKGRFEGLAFSPDGSRILAARFDDKTRKRAIVTIDPESGKVTHLTRDGDCFDAVFSPMSKR